MLFAHSYHQIISTNFLTKIPALNTTQCQRSEIDFFFRLKCRRFRKIQNYHNFATRYNTIQHTSGNNMYKVCFTIYPRHKLQATQAKKIRNSTNDYRQITFKKFERLAVRTIIQAWMTTVLIQNRHAMLMQ